MSIYLAFDHRPGVFAASNRGWTQFGEWVNSLEGSDEVAHLCQYGWNEPASGVVSEMESALKQSPPSDQLVAKTAGEVLEVLKGIPSDAAVIVTNGIGHDDSSDMDK